MNLHIETPVTPEGMAGGATDVLRRGLALLIGQATADAFAGVECEYAVYRDGMFVDFAWVLPKLAALAPRVGIPIRRESAHRYRLASGHLLMADGQYAEVATPPETIGRRTPRYLAASTLSARNVLVRLLDTLSMDTGEIYTIRGYSTHLNISDPGINDACRFAHSFALVFAPLMMLLTSVAPVLGAVVRPRRGRFELVTDCLTADDSLRAAVTAFIGAFEAQRSLEAARYLAPVRKLASGVLIAAVQRPGWRVNFNVQDHESRSARDARVPLSSGESGRLQDLASEAWALARIALVDRLDQQEVELTEALVNGGREVPFDAPTISNQDLRLARSGPAPPGVRRFTGALEPRDVAGWRIEPAFTAWSFLVLRCRNGRTERLVCLPLAACDVYAAGRADTLLIATLEAAAGGGALSELVDIADTTTPGVFSGVDKAALARQLEQIPFQVKEPPPKKRRKDCCEVSLEEDGTVRIGVPATADPEQVRAGIEQEPPRGDTKVGYGVWAHNQTFGATLADHQVKSLGLDFNFRRFYRSGNWYDGILGQGWDHAYNIRVVPERGQGNETTDCGWLETYPWSPGGDLVYRPGTGRVTRHAFKRWAVRQALWADASFTAVVSTYAQNPGEDFEIERFAVISGAPPDVLKDEPIFYRIRVRGGTRLLLNCHGYVAEIRDPNHNRMTFAYGGPYNVSTRFNVLSEIVDTVGRTYALSYYEEPVPKLKTLVSRGREVAYAYDDQWRLTTVELVRGDTGRPIVQYGWDSTQPDLLTSIIAPTDPAELDEPFLVNIYAPGERRLTAQVVGVQTGPRQAGGRYEFQPTTDGLRVVDRSRRLRTYVFRALGAHHVIRELKITDEVHDGALGMASRELVTTYDHDGNFHLTSTKSPSGQEQRYRYRNRNRRVVMGEEFDSLAQPPFAHANDLARDDLLDSQVIPSKAEQPSALVTRFQYEHLFNKPTRIADAFGVTSLRYRFTNRTAPAYNANPVRIAHPRQQNPTGSLAVVERLDYAPGGGLVWHRDPDGKIESYRLFDSGFKKGLIREHRLGGQLQRTSDYDDFRRLVVRTDARGGTWRYAYDARDNLLTADDPLFRVVANREFHRQIFRYDLNDREVHRTARIADDLSPFATERPIEVHGDYVETVTYDSLGARIAYEQRGSTIDAFGDTVDISRTWRWTYDAEGRVTRSRSPRSVSGERPDAQLRYEYNARGLVCVLWEGDTTEAAGVADTNAADTRFIYDEDDRLALKIDPGGQPYVTAFDGYGRPYTSTSPALTLQSRYDDHRPVLKRQWLEGELSVEPRVRVGSANDILQAGAVRRGAIISELDFVHDASQREILRREKVFLPQARSAISDTTTTAPNLIVRTWFTAAGRLRRSEDAARRVTRYTYDDQGRLEATIIPGGHQTRQTYEGDLPKNATTTFVPEAGYTPIPALATRPRIRVTETADYDGLGRLVRLTSQGVETSFAYDTLGRMRVRQGALGAAILVYDPIGRLTRRTNTHTQIGATSAIAAVNFGHDLNDNPVSLKDGREEETTARYDGHDRLVRVEQTGRPATVLERGRDGQIAALKRGDADRIDYGYDGAGRLVSLVAAAPGRSLTQIFGYDPAGRVTWCLDNNGDEAQAAVEVRRTYDSIGRLVRELSNRGSFDPTDRILDLAHAWQVGSNTRSQSLGGRTTTHVYGVDGNLKRIQVATGSGAAQTLLENVHQGPGRILETRQFINPAAAQPIRFLATNLYDAFGRLNRRSLWVQDEAFQPGQPLPPFERLLQLAAPEILAYGPSGLIREHRASIILRPEQLPPVIDVDALVLSAATPLVHLFMPLFTPTGTATPPVEIKTTFSYDGLARLGLAVEEGAAVTRRITRTWDEASRPTGIQVDTNQTISVGGWLVPANPSSTFTYTPPTDYPFRRQDGWYGNAARWTFDHFRRLADFVQVDHPEVHRTTTHDPLDRLVTVAFSKPRVATQNYLWDALGRLVGRRSDQRDLLGDGNCVYVYDGDLCVAEYARRGAAFAEVNTYAFDDRGQLVTCTRDQTAYAAIPTGEGAPWLLVHRNSRGTPTLLPTASYAQRQDYYWYGLQLLAESINHSPFDSPLTESIAIDYSGGSPQPQRLVTSRAKIGAGGQRHFPEAGLYYARGRFFDPALGGHLAPDSQFGWSDPLAMGNPAASVRSNNPLLPPSTAPADIEWGTASFHTAKSGAIGLGTAVLAGAAAAVGAVAAAVVAVGGVVVLGSQAVLSFNTRALNAAEHGVAASLGNVAVGAVMDTFGVTGLYEGWTGRDLLTDQLLTAEQRSERLGTGAGNLAAFVATLFLPDFHGQPAGARSPARAAQPRELAVPVAEAAPRRTVRQAGRGIGRHWNRQRGSVSVEALLLPASAAILTARLIVRRVKRKGHALEWEYRSRNHKLKMEGFETSGGAKGQLSFQEQLDLHTEPKAVARIVDAIEAGEISVHRGDYVLMRGLLPPCETRCRYQVLPELPVDFDIRVYYAEVQTGEIWRY